MSGRIRFMCAAFGLGLTFTLALAFLIKPALAVGSIKATVQKPHCKVVKKMHVQKKKRGTCAKPPHKKRAPPLFGAPSDLAVDSRGNVVVADQGSKRILMLSQKGKVIARWSKAGTNPKTFEQLYGIALDSAQNVYVTDAANRVLDKLSSKGQPLSQYSTDVAEANSFPTLLTVAVNGDIYVSDHTAQAVLHLSPQGALVDTVGKGELADPYGVTTGPDGNLYVADFGADLVREYTPDGKELGTWGAGANGTVQIQKPEAVAVKSDGTIYVSEQINKIVGFDRSGKVLANWGPTRTRLLSDPSGLALDSSGNLYVAEYSGDRVDKLSPAGKVLGVWK